jgi:hypothetical protein
LKSSPVYIRTPWGRRRRMATSFSALSRLILIPSTLAVFSSITVTAVSIAAMWSALPQ